MMRKQNLPLTADQSLLILFFALLFLSSSASAQRLFVNRTDTVTFEQVSDSVRQWSVNDKTFFFQIKDSLVKFTPLSNCNYWKFDENSEIWTIPKTFRLWYSEGELAVWRYDASMNDWLRKGFAVKETLSDSVFLWNVNDSISFTSQKGERALWKTDRNTVYTPDWSLHAEVWSLNDTTSFVKFDSLQYLQVYDDSTQVWELERKPSVWKISDETSIWTVLPNIEVWRAGKRINLWSQNKYTQKWHVNDTLPKISRNRKHRLWLINKDLKVVAIEDSVQIWKRNKHVKVWTLSDWRRAWHYIPPPPPKVHKDTTDSIAIPGLEEKIKQLSLDKNNIAWIVDEKTQIWQFKGYNELWNKEEALHLWSVNDSTLIWTLHDNYRITKLNGIYKFWEKPSGQKHWLEMRKLKFRRLSDTAVIANLNEKLCITKFNGKILAWNINKNLVISQRPQKRFWEINDTVSYWQVSDTILLKNRGKELESQKWKLQDYSQLHVNDSIKFWKIDAATRVSRMGDSLAVWMFQDSWKVLDSVASQHISDTVRVWELRDDLHIWQGQNSTQFWQIDKQAKTYKLRDSILAWTYYIPPEKENAEAKSNWTFKNQVKLNSYQTQLRNWAKGGESSISLQTEGRFEANYAKEKVRWASWLEVKYGLNKPGEKDFQKTEDKIELDSRLNYTRNSLLAYSLHSNVKTQIAPGYNYSTEEQISDFFAPVYFNLGVGLDYTFYKMFSLYLSPITVKLTHVSDTATINQTKFGIAQDRQTLNQTGAYVNGRLNFNLTKDIQIVSRFNLFSNYFEKPENIDIDWFLELIMKVNKYITADISVQMIYDNDIKIPIYQDIAGKQEKVGEGPRLQMKEIFKIGFLFSF